MRTMARRLRIYSLHGLVLAVCCVSAWAQTPVEPHHQLVPLAGAERRAALTLDACGGHFDAPLLDFLVRERIPATLFVTRRWIRRNPQGVAAIKAHADLFQVEDHGADHVPAVIGPQREVYGIPGLPDLGHLRSEVGEGARAIEQAFGVTPHWYRGATAMYDPQALTEIERLGYRVTGFSLNADAGATLSQVAIERRLQQAQNGDVIIAHMNKPASGTARGLAVGLTELRRQGFVFVRLDQASLQAVPPQRTRLQ